MLRVAGRLRAQAACQGSITTLPPTVRKATTMARYPRKAMRAELRQSTHQTHANIKRATPDYDISLRNRARSDAHEIRGRRCERRSIQLFASPFVINCANSGNAGHMLGSHTALSCSNANQSFIWLAHQAGHRDILNSGSWRGRRC